MNLLNEEIKNVFQKNQKKRDELSERMDLIDFGDFYFSLVNSLPLGILIHDSRQIIFLNKMASNILDGEPKDFIGHPLTNIFPDSNQGKYIEEYRKIIKGESTFTYQDVMFVKKGGENIAIKTLGIPLEERHGLIAQVVFLTEDALEKLLNQIK